MSDTSDLTDLAHGTDQRPRGSTQVDNLKALLKAPETSEELDIPPAVV